MPEITIPPISLSNEDAKAIKLYASKRKMTGQEVVSECFSMFIQRCREEMYMVESKMVVTAYRNATPEQRAAIKSSLGITL